MKKPPESVPDILYRGRILPPSAISPALFTEDLIPDSEPKIDSQGRKTVNDGNEYGVYMTDNPKMVDVSYGSPQGIEGESLPDSPIFNYPGRYGATVQSPSVGVTYKIKTEGVDIRKPWIRSQLQGVYNNGFQGDEYIADVIPADNHEITKFTLGPDIFHESKDFEIGEEPEKALEDLRLELDRRMGRLAIACDKIKELPPEGKTNIFAIKKILTSVLGPDEIPIYLK